MRGTIRTVDSQVKIYSAGGNSVSEVRLTVDVEEEGHPDVEVFVTRATQRHLGLEEGTTVWLTTEDAGARPRIEAVSG